MCEGNGGYVGMGRGERGAGGLEHAFVGVVWYCKARWGRCRSGRGRGQGSYVRRKCA